MSLYQYCRECGVEIDEDGDVIHGYCSRCNDTDVTTMSESETITVDEELASKAALQLDVVASLERMRGNDELADSLAATAGKLGKACATANK